MKKYTFLITVFFSIVISAQFKPPGSFDFDKAFEFKNESILEMAIVETYKPQLGFYKLDSLSKEKFKIRKVEVKFSRGKIIEYDEIDNLDDKYFNEFKTYKIIYDRNNNVQKVIHSTKNYSKDETKITYTYNADSTEVIEKYYHSDNIKYDRAIINTVKNNKVIKEVEDYRGILKERYYDFDKHGNEIYSKSYGVETKTKNTYNAQNKIIKSFTTNNFGKKFLRVYTYNSVGKIINKKSFQGSFIKPKTEISYTYENGRLKKINEISHTYNEVKSRIYTYDKYGNWVTQQILKGEIETRLIRRKLIYKTKV